MDIDLGKMAQDCIEAIQKKIKELKTINIAVVGKTGVGKSTLINSVFREPLAKVGVGRPVTQDIKQYQKKGFPLTIYDTRGYELDNKVQNSIMDQLLNLFNKQRETGDINDAIHCVWYCVDSGSERFEEKELEWIRKFTDETSALNVPVIIVMTKTISKKQSEKFYEYIRNLNLHVIQVVRVLAQDYELDDGGFIRAQGLDVLIEVMMNALPDELQDTLQHVQKVSIEAKHKRAQAAIAAAVTAAAATGVAPIPFSDAALLIPTQVAMIASITAVYGLDIDKSILSSFISSVLGTTATTIAGKTLVSNLLKFIPGIGTAAGAVISGSTAGTLTTALGEAYVCLMDAIYKGEIKKSDMLGDRGKEYITNILKTKKKK